MNALEIRGLTKRRGDFALQGLDLTLLEVDWELNNAGKNGYPFYTRSEFLAVLGDQKNGRNLEAPESLIRQIFREETGSSQGSNTYNVSVSASGRKFLDIVLEEGELRRNRNGGKNPFKLDD